MNNNVKKGTRKIRILDKTYKKGEMYLHPLTLSIQKVKTSKFTPTEIYLDKNKLKKSGLEEDNLNYSQEEIRNYMAIPYLLLNYEIMADFYNIDNIDNFNNLMNSNINENNPYNHINRIINIWIKYNFDDLKKYNEYIYSIFKKINNKYKKLEYNSEKVKIFINTWINNKNINDFEFNLFEDIYKFIKN